MGASVTIADAHDPQVSTHLQTQSYDISDHIHQCLGRALNFLEDQQMKESKWGERNQTTPRLIACDVGSQKANL